MEVREALDVQHVHLVHKQHAGDELGHALVYVAVHHLVDLSAELIWSNVTTADGESQTKPDVFRSGAAGSFSLPVISVFLGFMSCPIMERMSWPP